MVVLRSHEAVASTGYVVDGKVPQSSLLQTPLLSFRDIFVVSAANKQVPVISQAVFADALSKLFFLLGREANGEFVIVFVKQEMCELINLPFATWGDYVADLPLRDSITERRKGYVFMLGDRDTINNGYLDALSPGHVVV